MARKSKDEPTPQREKERREQIVESASFQLLKEFCDGQAAGTIPRFRDLFKSIEDGLYNREYTLTPSFLATLKRGEFGSPGPAGFDIILKRFVENLKEAARSAREVVKNKDHRFFAEPRGIPGDNKEQAGYISFAATRALTNLEPLQHDLQALFNGIYPANFKTVPVYESAPDLEPLPVSKWQQEKRSPEDRAEVQRQLDEIKAPLERFLKLFSKFQEENHAAFKEQLAEAQWIANNKRGWHRWLQASRERGIQ